MANPRKFSEKIALHMQKQAEESAAFDQIMKSVNEVKPTPTNQLLNITPLLNQRHGGSLPNVNQMAQQGDKGHSSRQMFNPSSTSPRGSRNSIGPVRLKQNTRASDHSPYNSPPSVLSSSIPSSGQLSGFNPSALPSFFCGTNYLSLPLGNRRTISDSALNSNSMLIPSTVPHSSEESSNNSNDPYDIYLNQLPNHGSSNTSPHQQDSPGGGRALTGSGDGGYLEIPANMSSLTGSGVSAGSLPDLTSPNYHFPSPIQQPLDMDEHQQLHSPYSPSPVTYSPSNLSSSHASPVGGGAGLNNQMLHHQQQQQSQVQQMSQQQQQQHSPRSPNAPMHNNPLHVNIVNSTNNSFQQSFQQDNIMMYRNPQRPSPQNSPNPYRSASPLDGQLSAPSSPSPGQPTQASSSDYLINQQAYQLQQHFELISVADRERERNGGWKQGNQYYYNQFQGDNTLPGQNQTSPLHQQQQPQTPQTPSSIPEINISEFLGPDFSDIRSSEVEGFLREGLGPLDMDGFQLLNESDSLQLDPQTEDTFRLDRL